MMHDAAQRLGSIRWLAPAASRTIAPWSNSPPRRESRVAFGTSLRSKDTQSNSLRTGMGTVFMTKDPTTFRTRKRQVQVCSVPLVMAEDAFCGLPLAGKISQNASRRVTLARQPGSSQGHFPARRNTTACRVPSRRKTRTSPMRDSDVRRLLRGDDEGVGASLSGSAETSTVTSSENIISAASQASLSNALALKENADTHAKVRRCRDVSHRVSCAVPRTRVHPKWTRAPKAIAAKARAPSFPATVRLPLF